MKHYNEVELLEHYYLNGGDSPAIVEHVQTCPECSARYARLREKLSCSALDHQQLVEAKPETFWGRQRSGVMRQLSQREQTPARGVAWRFAVAAVLMLFAGGLVFLIVNQPVPPEQVVQSIPAAPTDAATAALEETPPTDPWNSDELQTYAELVEWESWLEEEAKEGTS